MLLRISECFIVLERLERLREFQKGERTVNGPGDGGLLGRYTLEPISDSKDFKISPRKKKTPEDSLRISKGRNVYNGIPRHRIYLRTSWMHGNI